MRMLKMRLQPRRFGKSLYALAVYAAAHGWSIEPTKGGHLRLRKPGYPTVYTSKTPSDWRSVHNAVARLARIDREKLRQTILVVDEGIPAV